MEPDFTGVLVLCFNKINAPDLGKESPVITDVNDKEHSVDVMRRELARWFYLLSGDSSDCLSLHEACAYETQR